MRSNNCKWFVPGTAMVLLALMAGGCGALGTGAPPDAPEIEAASGTIPDELARETWVREFWPSDPPRPIARLRLRNGSFLYVTDWRSQPRCRLLYVAKDDGSDRRFSRTTCGLLPLGFRGTDEILDLSADRPDDGVSPRITTGTIDSSIQELRITFTDCGSRTYPQEGPIVPSMPSRRVFLLDMGSCSWGKLEALRDGTVVDTYESYPNAD